MTVTASSTTREGRKTFPYTVLLAAASMFLATAVQAAPPDFRSQDQELLYYWGTTFGQQVEAGGITRRREIDLIIRGLRDGAAGKAPGFSEEHRSLLNNLLVRRSQEAAAAEAAVGRKFLEQMAAEPGAIVTDSGLIFRELMPGEGAAPVPGAVVTVHYTGKLRTGRVFDSSFERELPLEARLDRVIDCWAQGIPLMRVGGKARITCPPELAYGNRSTDRIPGGSVLTFDVELLGTAAPQPDF